ncbi:triosephosphate isomerase [Inhella inkyongensis]|uniref:Triosephosphate isomerase n=1 Tax=Inhella inkyongensis TaxID=392593 RepID=A0A840S6K3_9BURK|nr:triose-phosphate isomerase [Inhella inkyongensis]MBB5205323.1 triosephosphate isomerase [Inhella inkyongensis]
MRKTLVVGNWKMNGTRAFAAGLLSELKALSPWAADVAVCVPHPLLADAAQQLQGTVLAWGGQDCSVHAAGAYTGEVSAAMLADWGCRYVIVGHSERRAYHAESDETVARKAQAALAQGLTPIVCVGETLAEREAAQTDAVVTRQLAAVIALLGERIQDVVVAYEPVWAIGTGLTATPAQAQAVHALLRAQLAAATPAAASMRLLYGGSVKPDNAAELFAQADIDGGLIGGAALKAADFDAICRA